ncbi:hypothetical protein PRIC2_014441 [Phytophthora ramorum]
MLESQYSASPAADDGNFTNQLGFRPIVLYDTRVDVADESLTLSRSMKDQQLPQFPTLSSYELDEIDASCTSRVSSQDHQQANAPSTPIPQTPEYSPPSRPRERGFAVGDVMFNYRALGSLRSGLAPIALLSRWHAGLAVTTFASGAAVAFVHAAYRPILFATLHGKFDRDYDVGVALLDWPGMLSVLLGLFSDCVPIYGTRRKAYIALGWFFSALSYASVCAIYAVQISEVEKPARVFGRLLEAWSVIGSFALQLSWVAALALVVGFGQREALSERGGLAMLFLILWQAGALTAHITVAELQSRLTLLNSSAVLATTSVISLPFVLYFLHDDDEQESTATLVASAKRVGVVSAIRTGVIQLWEICQEKITSRVLFFLLIYGVLLQAYDPGLYGALARWSGFTTVSDSIYAESPWMLVVESSVAIVALLHAKWRLLGTSWRPLAVTGTGVVVAGTLIQATMIATDTVRTKWGFSLLMGVVAWPRTWILLFIMLSITEVAHVGCEGVTMGLVLSSQGLGTSTINAATRWVSETTSARVTRDMIDEDSRSTRIQIVRAATMYAAVNLLSAAAVPMIPRNKLETQQLRAFGGYNRRGAVFIALLFVLLLALEIGVNLHTA